MTEPTSAKKQRLDKGTGLNGQQESHQQVTSSSGPLDAMREIEVEPESNSATCDLMSEADRALQESNKRHIKPVVDEAKLGIELFVGDRCKQYHGLIKSRYADFIVHEIDIEGKPAHLTSLEPPEEEEPSSSDAIKLEDIFKRDILMCLSNVNQGLLDSYKIDVTGLDKDTRTSIHHAIKASYDRLDSSTVSGDSDIPDFKKHSRVNGQQLGQVKDDEDKQAQGSSESEEKEKEANDADTTTNAEAETGAESDAKLEPTAKVGDKRYILVRKLNKVNKPKNVWPRSRPDYTHFVLYKENKDTMDAIHNVAVATYSKPAHFNYAGTKDRRAVTTQWVSSWRLDPKRLINAMRRYNKRPYLKVGNFCFKKEPIRLGQLRANKFDIVIRHLVHNSGGVKVIEDAMEYVKQNGFINYFGLQRFGTRSVFTHEIGLAILQGKWDKAVELILSYRYDDSTQPLPNAQDNSETSTTLNNQLDSANSASESNQGFQARQNQRNQNKRWASGAEQHNACVDLWKSKQDADLVFKKYPHFRMTNEGLIIKSLCKPGETGSAHARAVESLPRNIRSMYVHSYQSLLWNKLTTFRLKQFGYTVVPGDLILRPDANISDNSLDILLAVDEPDTPDLDLALSKIEETSKSTDKKIPVEEVDENIVIATEADLDKYTIFDVVLPLIGTRTRIPTNNVGQELERLLSENSLTIESFKAREKAFISYGSYRKIMVRPDNLIWSIKQYSNPHENLIDTDLDLLQKKESTTTNDKSQTTSSPIKSDSSDEALLVSFELPPSSYATMCLRELMKKPSTDFNNRF